MYLFIIICMQTHIPSIEAVMPVQQQLPCRNNIV